MSSGGIQGVRANPFLECRAQLRKNDVAMCQDGVIASRVQMQAMHMRRQRRPACSHAKEGLIPAPYESMPDGLPRRLVVAIRNSKRRKEEVYPGPCP